MLSNIKKFGYYIQSMYFCRGKFTFVQFNKLIINYGTN